MAAPARTRPVLTTTHLRYWLYRDPPPVPAWGHTLDARVPKAEPPSPRPSIHECIAAHAGGPPWWNGTAYRGTVAAANTWHLVARIARHLDKSAPHIVTELYGAHRIGQGLRGALEHLAERPPSGGDKRRDARCRRALARLARGVRPLRTQP
jgi:hypothetical protein